jgi:hypothetical protein
VTRGRFTILAIALVALNAFFWLAPGGLALSRGVIQDLFGARLIRAEVVWQAPDGSIQDTQVARGWIRAVTPEAITLRERDRPFDTIPISTSVAVRGLQVASVNQLQRGMRVVVIRPANGPAATIVVEALR